MELPADGEAFADAVRAVLADPRRGGRDRGVGRAPGARAARRAARRRRAPRADGLRAGAHAVDRRGRRARAATQRPLAGGARPRSCARRICRRGPRRQRPRPRAADEVRALSDEPAARSRSRALIEELRTHLATTSSPSASSRSTTRRMPARAPQRRASGPRVRDPVHRSATAREHLHPDLHEPRGLAGAVHPVGAGAGPPNIEVVVVGDAAPPETAAAIEELAIRACATRTSPSAGPTRKTRRRWLVAGTGPLNRSIELARGEWIAINNDDDALRPNHVSRLLARRAGGPRRSRLRPSGAARARRVDAR